ncbi:MAG TPA: hypothetical protein VI793_18000 [Anaerolineales bacterium]|nr:hypothetical protein [Anaerolineales bacterium]
MARAASPVPLRLYLLGQFRLLQGDQPASLPTRKAELLLAYLALQSGEHSRLRDLPAGGGRGADRGDRAAR